MALRVAIIGAGLMGRWHAHYVSAAGGQVVAIVDPNPVAAERLHRSHRGAQLFADLSVCIKQTRFDVIHICTGLDSHASLVRVALEAGKHVLCEKPLAPDVAQTQSLLDLARDKNLQLCPVHQFPFQRGMQRICRRIDRLGDLVRLDYATYSAGGEGKSPQQRRGVLREIVPHPVSLFDAILGPGDPTWRILRHTDDDLEISGLWCEIPISIRISLRARPTRNELLATGTGATALADLFHGFALIDSGQVSQLSKAIRPIRFSGKLLWTATTNLAYRALHGERAYPGLDELIRRFYRAAQAAGSPPVSIQQTLAAAHLMEMLG